jgi:hypothetical protein
MYVDRRGTVASNEPNNFLLAARRFHENLAVHSQL